MAPTIMKFHSPRFRKRIAIFDYDGTLVRPKENRPFPKNVADWEWTHSNVPETLHKTYQQGFMVIICTQQSRPWKLDQIRAVLEPLQIPMYISVATEKEDYKPSTVVFDAVVPATKIWDRDASFMIGDALGRAGDWSDCDKKFAEALGVYYKSPEDMFQDSSNTNTGAETRDDGNALHALTYGNIVPPNAAFITKDMHIKLLEWKMAHGKRRPMLMKYAKELSEKEVEDTSRDAFALCDAGKHLEAVEKYKTLKGTGYALASLVLATHCKKIPFMSDTLLGKLFKDANGKFKYDKKEFMACYDYVMNMRT